MTVRLFTAVVFLFNSFTIIRLPDAPHDSRTAEERQVTIPGAGPMKNIGWLVDKADAPWVICRCSSARPL